MSNSIQNKNGATEAPTRTPAEIVAGFMAQRCGYNHPSGYAPGKVYESARNAPLFAAWFEALPDDLTGLDLSPLYAIADNGQYGQLQSREGKWEPNPNNLGTEYNGPLGEDKAPMRRNKAKWEAAFEKARIDHENRFKADEEAMLHTDLPIPLRQAAEGLMNLALHPDDDGNGHSHWDQSQSPEDVVATAAAIRIIRRALDEIEQGVAAEIAFDCAERLRREIKGVSQVTKKYELPTE